eukprot:158350_1
MNQHVMALKMAIIVAELEKFGFEEDEVLDAMQNITNPFDANEIVDYIEKQRQKSKQLVLFGADEDNDDEKAILDMFKGVIGLAVVEQNGFMVATKTNKLLLTKRLNAINPSGTTLLRDAVVKGMLLMLELKGLLQEIGALNRKFVHIVLTDGADTGSKASLDLVRAFFFKVGEELGNLCKTYFIGCDVAKKELIELATIAILGGDACELFECSDNNVDDIFDHIQIDLGIRTEYAGIIGGGGAMFAEKKSLFAQVQKKNFLVLFTLDVSGSMRGKRWNAVIRAMRNFLNNLDEDDILGCVLFNHKVELIT